MPSRSFLDCWGWVAQRQWTAALYKASITTISLSWTRYRHLDVPLLPLCEIHDAQTAQWTAKCCLQIWLRASSIAAIYGQFISTELT